jgi:hypothetical protein
VLANWIKQNGSLATPGTGPITVAAVTGYPTLYTRFGLNRPFHYVVRNTDGTPVSSEIGYLSDATTLVRSKALEVADDASNGAPSLPSLSGSYLIETAGDAGLISAAMPAVFASGAGVVKRFAGQPVVNLASLATMAMAAGAIYQFPIYVDTPGALNALMLDISTAVAGASVRAGIYAMQSDGSPGALLADTGDMSAATVASVSASIGPLNFAPGWYWGAVVASAAISIRSMPNMVETPYGWDATARYKRILSQISGTYGALPTTPTFPGTIITNASSSNVPLMWLVLA